MRKIYLWLLAIAALLPLNPAMADLRTPAWWDPDGVGVGQDWHYRIPVTLPASSSINSTATVDIAFGAQLLNLGVNPGSSTFDNNSVRVVDSNGILVPTQQFTDRRFANATDPANNGAGEVRWIVTGNGAQVYYVYFDIISNGAKPSIAAQAINGSFEQSSAGQTSPLGWTTTRLSGFDGEVRPSETVFVVDNGAASSGQSRNTNGTPNSGSFSFLMGRRTNPEAQVSILNGSQISRSITVPATNPGNLTFRYRLEGWDSGANGNGSIGDYLRAQLSNGPVATIIVGPATGNDYITNPFSPNFGLNPASPLQSGFGQYNGFDTTTTGVHTAGGTINNGQEIWLNRTVSLSSFAGLTIQIGFSMFNSNGHRSWVHIDDVEWSVVNGALGAAEGFGVVITSSPPSPITSNQPLPVTARVDARPTGAGQPVIAEVYVSNTNLLGSFPLFNDGAHGDGAANDAIWANDGTDAANPVFVIPSSQPADIGGRIRVTARDGSTSTLGAANNGRIHRVGQPNAVDEANYWNVDQTNFTFIPGNLNVTKTSLVLDDPINTSNDKAIPGATVRYCLTITNTGASANNIRASDILPPEVTYIRESIRSGATCATATNVEDDDAIDGDFGDMADGVSASFDTPTRTISVIRPALSAGQSFAVTFNVTVN